MSDAESTHIDMEEEAKPARAQPGPSNGIESGLENKNQGNSPVLKKYKLSKKSREIKEFDLTLDDESLPDIELDSVPKKKFKKRNEAKRSSANSTIDSHLANMHTATM